MPPEALQVRGVIDLSIVWRVNLSLVGLLLFQAAEAWVRARARESVEKLAIAKMEMMANVTDGIVLRLMN
jgi:hypothetical protein